MHTVSDTADAYTLRRFSTADVQDYLDLLETVWGNRKSTAWFRWRFDDNPYVSEIPSVVATHEGEVVGIESCLALRLRIGDQRPLAFQPVDWAVHPAHRKRGLCSRMTERLLEVVAETPADLYYNFPSEALVPCLRKFDWRMTTRPTTRYRIQNPAALTSNAAETGSSLSTTLLESLGRLATPVARQYLKYSDRVAGPDSRVSIERSGTIPVDDLVALYERTVPEDIHVLRDEEFYRWRFENPRWDPTTYLVRRDGRVAAACIVCTETTGAGFTRTSILDALPRDRSAPDELLRALLAAVVTDASGVDLLRVNATGFPPRVLRTFGFWTADSFPLSWLSKQTPMAVRPASLAGEQPWRIDGTDLTDGSAWGLSLAGQDVG